MSKKKKKEAKKNKPRPVFVCPKCGSQFVSDWDNVCWICKIPGEPKNEAAVRMARWREREGDILGDKRET